MAKRSLLCERPSYFFYLPLRLQVSGCSTFCIMCDVPSTAVFCTEYIECFPSMASKFVLKHFVTNPVNTIITGIIIDFMFNIRCVCVCILNTIKFFISVPIEQPGGQVPLTFRNLASYIWDGRKITL